jgi:hypothetical protein
MRLLANSDLSSARRVAEANVVRAVCHDNLANGRVLAAAVILDTISARTTFVAADGGGGFGRDDPATRVYLWLFSALEAILRDARIGCL